MQIGPLLRVSLPGLSDVFSEEIQAWENELSWDYRPANEVIKRFVSSDSLPGFIMLAGDKKLVGYGFYVTESYLGFIGNHYILDEFATDAHYQLLVSRLFDSLRIDEGVRRIECQTFGFNGDFPPIYQTLGFQVFPRLFLTLELEGWSVPAGEAASKAGRIGAWDERLVFDIAELIHDSHINSPDADICQDYRSRGGCLRFVKNLLQNPACGRFSRAHSRVAYDRRGRLCGVLLASHIHRRTGMIPQVSVRRDAQRQGFGHLLLYSYLESARSAGFEKVTLSVSVANERALSLYKRIGFGKTRAFNAFVWESS